MFKYIFDKIIYERFPMVFVYLQTWITSQKKICNTYAQLSKLLVHIMNHHIFIYYITITMTLSHYIYHMFKYVHYESPIDFQLFPIDFLPQSITAPPSPRPWCSRHLQHLQEMHPPSCWAPPWTAAVDGRESGAEAEGNIIVTII